jgi:K(+)-stimulated pyrophosphate-energized sodium pump
LIILKQDKGSKQMIEISEKIHKGAMVFLKKEYFILIFFVIFVSLVIFWLINQAMGVAFIIGAISSATAGFIGMTIATVANVRTAQAAKKGLGPALKVAFNSGTVISMTSVSLGLLGIILIYLIFGDPNIIFGFAFGASSIALFARVGGGIYTKAADMGADLVGKVEAGIPEDDPRNPAVIADNVGDNVGDVAGMGADLFESYVGSIIAAMVMGAMLFGYQGLLFPLQITAVGIVSSIIGTFAVKTRSHPEKAFRDGLLLTSLLVAVGTYFIVINTFTSSDIFWAILIGLFTGVLVGWNTEIYTSAKHKPVQSIAEAAKTGPATTIIKGLVVGMKSTQNSMLFIGLAIFFAFHLSGLYGIAVAAVAMLSTLGISLAIDAYGPVVDNAGGIAEMSGLPKRVRKITDKLDAAGNTTAAMGKGFAIGSAALTALILFTSYVIAADLSFINITQPRILMGLLIGAMLPFLFSALTMNSVGKAAFLMMREVRRQFRDKRVLKGTKKADYKKCIEISTHAALTEMVAPGLLVVSAPLIVGILFGLEALGGLLAGALITGVAMAITLSNAGAAWDNAKKSVEAMPQKGKAWKDLHDATVIGDTVGDPFKDTSGPALNILIKLMSIVSLVFIPLFQNPIF